MSEHGSRQTTSATVLEYLKRALEDASRHDPNDVERPAAVLWTDAGARWRPIIAQLRRMLPQLLTLGDYDSKRRIGPSIWLRCAVDAPAALRVGDDATPILYLPGVGRPDLNARTCVESLRPLVELQYRGVCWTQKNGRDWTVEAFLVSRDGGLGLDVVRDTATRASMLRALSELGTTRVGVLRDKRLDAEDFDRLLSDDPVRDVLVWLSDAEAVKSGWGGDRWNAFRSQCRTALKFDPDHGVAVAAERLGMREDRWHSVWERFAESPILYPGIPELLDEAMPNDLFAGPPSSWPRNNREGEDTLRRALADLASRTPKDARERVAELEREHGSRRDWVWAKLDRSPLALAVGHLAELNRLAASELGGTTADDMAAMYVDGAWRVDAEALSSMATVHSAVDAESVSKCLDAIYRPWLEASAQRLQSLVDESPMPRDGSDADDARVRPGTIILFADGLRFDVSQRLVGRLEEGGRKVFLTTRWAALPTVTATAKPAVSPVAERIGGISIGEDFLPESEGRSLTAPRFRKLLMASNFQVLGADETGEPSGRAWTETGELDKLGHALQAKLAPRVDEQVSLLLERIESLLAVGWLEVRVVTDHGWLWLPGGLPKVDLPQYLTESRWARCASMKGQSTVNVPTVAWHWNTEERVAVAPGVACFKSGYAYAHGGVSLQECLVPVIRVRPGAARVSIRIAAVSWVRLRCRVRVEPAEAGLAVELRTRVADTDSNLGEGRLDEAGSASLLIEDDELEGASAVIVVLDANGSAVAKQPTIIGGDE